MLFLPDVKWFLLRGPHEGACHHILLGDLLLKIVDLSLESVVIFGLVLYHDRHCLASTLGTKIETFSFRVGISFTVAGSIHLDRWSVGTSSSLRYTSSTLSTYTVFRLNRRNEISRGRRLLEKRRNWSALWFRGGIQTTLLVFQSVVVYLGVTRLVHKYVLFEFKYSIFVKVFISRLQSRSFRNGVFNFRRVNVFVSGERRLSTNTFYLNSNI